jgi:hypothetical protein
MEKLAALLLAICLSLLSMGALAAASAGFPCDFQRVVRRRAPACAPVQRPLVSMARGTLIGS